MVLYNSKGFDNRHSEEQRSTGLEQREIGKTVGTGNPTEIYTSSTVSLRNVNFNLDKTALEGKKEKENNYYEQINSI